MNFAATRLKSLAMSLGADLVGVTTRDLLADGPPSADPCYLLPSANSVICFALSLDPDIARDFMSKKNWRPHCDNRKLIINSGTAALKMDGSHEVADENAVEVPTPFGLHVVVPREELSEGQPKIRKWPGQFPLDRKVIEYLCQQISGADGV